jgi:hypothetical protein
MFCAVTFIDPFAILFNYLVCATTSTLVPHATNSILCDKVSTLGANFTLSFFQRNFITRQPIMHTAKISGTGHYVPERIVTNEHLSTLMDTTDEWIKERTGIRERRWVEEGDGNTAATMGVKAARNAIKAAGIEPEEIGHIVFATISPDYYFPGCGVQVQEALGIHTAGATDVRNACSGFIYALSVG